MAKGYDIILQNSKPNDGEPMPDNGFPTGWQREDERGLF